MISVSLSPSPLAGRFWFVVVLGLKRRWDGVGWDGIVGKTLAFTNIKFWNEKDEVFARGSHTK